MYYIVYQTTNKINGKFYIGMHKTNNINDGYLGSGVLLEKAIKKYGKENFIRDILFECKCEKEMILFEEALLTEEYIKSNFGKIYNLASGGKGGGFIWELLSEEKKKELSENQRILMINNNPMKREDLKEKASERWSRNNPSQRPEQKKRISEIHTGKIISEETRKRMSDSQKVAIRSEESNKKRSMTLKGRVPWNKGLKISK